MLARTPFTDPVAVETWDAAFRWRQGSTLRDRTIDATWLRVATAIAAVEEAGAESWARRWIDGFSRWQWLPDETLLRTAGTDTPPTPAGPLAAMLNMRTFVTPRPMRGRQGAFDTEAIAATAASALRFLDDALLVLPAYEEHGVSIGMFGMADALHEMGIAYESQEALDAARDAAAALARGALQGTIELARERGGRAPARSRMAVLADNGLPRTLIDDAMRWGVRHEPRTTIAQAPLLARLANNTSDALDPVPIESSMGDGSGRHSDAFLLPAPVAQLRLRLAIQAWIDRPIDYPLVVPANQPEAMADEARALARQTGLPPPRFRAHDATHANQPASMEPNRHDPDSDIGRRNTQ